MTPFSMSKSVVTSMMSYQSLLLPESFHAPNPDVAPPTTQREKVPFSVQVPLGAVQVQMIRTAPKWSYFKNCSKKQHNLAMNLLFGFGLLLLLLLLLCLYGLVFASSGRLSQTEKN